MFVAVESLFDCLCRMFAGHKTRFAAVLIWAMIPLTVFASLPRVGCICANGQHKFYCERSRMSGSEGLCTCCYGKGPAKAAVQGATSTPMACCGHERSRCANRMAAVASDRPCRPVLDRSIFVQGAKASSIDLARAEHAPLFTAVGLLPLLACGVAHDFDRRELLPPPDLVITLGVLLI